MDVFSGKCQSRISMYPGERWTYGRPQGPIIMFHKASTHCIVTHPGAVYLCQLYLQMSYR